MTTLARLMFEHNSLTGDPDSFDSAVTDSGKLAVAAAAALASTSYGVSALLGGSTSIYGTKAISVSTSVVRCRFYFDPNGAGTLGDISWIDICYIDTSSGMLGGAEWYTNSSAEHYIRGFVYNDAGTRSYATAISISDAEHYVEFEINRAASAVSGDGSFEISVDGGSVQSVTSIDNYDRFGAINAVEAGAIDTYAYLNEFAGTMYLDEIVINDTGDTIGERDMSSVLWFDRREMRGASRGVMRGT